MAWTPSSVTGNMLRDYLTDLFPILGTGTLGQDACRSCRRPPVVACTKLRRRLWLKHAAAAGAREPPALGFSWVNFALLAVSLEDPADKTGNAKAVLAETLDAATGKLLTTTRTPAPRPASWTTVAASSTWPVLGTRAGRKPKTSPNWPPFAPLGQAAGCRDEQKIVDELNAVQGKFVDIGGYYMPDTAKLAIMRPSQTFNNAPKAAGLTS